MAKKTFWGQAAEYLTGKGLRAQDVAELRTQLEPMQTTDDDDTTSLGQVMDAVKKMGDSVKKALDWQAARDAEEKEDRERTEAAQRAKDAGEEEARKKKEKEVKEETGDTIIEAEEVGTVISLGKVWAGKTGDASINYLQEIGSRAEVIAPGLGASMPTADACKGNRGAVLSNYMRTALKTLRTRDALGAEMVDPFLLGKPVEELRGVALLGAFNGVSELAKIRNNAASRTAAAPIRTKDNFMTVAQTSLATYRDNIAKYNKEKAASDTAH